MRQRRTRLCDATLHATPRPVAIKWSTLLQESPGLLMVGRLWNLAAALALARVLASAAGVTGLAAALPLATILAFAGVLMNLGRLLLLLGRSEEFRSRDQPRGRRADSNCKFPAIPVLSPLSLYAF